MVERPGFNNALYQLIMHSYNIHIDPSKLKPGVSGFMRVKNDAQYIEGCVETCIDALDELIIVWNDCSDNSAEVIEKVCRKYPSKVKAYEYLPKVYSINLTKEEYEFIKTEPDSSEHLLCNYYNFALSKVTNQYAMKIDADQYYYPEKLKEWCDVIRKPVTKRSIASILGFFVWGAKLFFERKTYKSGRIYLWLPKDVTGLLGYLYKQYVKFRIGKYGESASLSGLDVVRKDAKWYVTLGKKNDIMNILPPYNGVGDHLIFKLAEDTHFRRDDCKFYNTLRSDSFTYIEWLEHHKRRHDIGSCWYHLNAMRYGTYAKILKSMEEFPDSFCEVKQFSKKWYITQLLPKMDKSMFVPYQNSLFQFIHQVFYRDLTKYLYILKNIKDTQ